MNQVTEFAATGRRKTSSARVRLIPGSGKVTVNNRPFESYFPVESQRTHALQPLFATDTVSKYDVVVNVHGGGQSGQAGAMRHGIARALLQADPTLKATLRAGGFLTRDPRMRERKKYGQPGARKRFQYSKR
ncbi:MAG TPA: 30S ribosomal protein S9 [Verrucomicrobiota bacterium]|nr:30S ribosomal protein S9 [Verrucomicrobiota bacterium]